jgi:hypothetical protein
MVRTVSAAQTAPSTYARPVRADRLRALTTPGELAGFGGGDATGDSPAERRYPALLRAHRDRAAR